MYIYDAEAANVVVVVSSPETGPPVPHLFEVGSCSILETSKANLNRSCVQLDMGSGEVQRGRQNQTAGTRQLEDTSSRRPWRIIHLVHLGSRVKPTSWSSPPPLDHLASRQNRNAHYFVSLPKFTSGKSVGSVTTPPFFPGHQRQMRRVVYGG